MPEKLKIKLIKSTPKFYKRGQHKSLSGLCIHQDWIIVRGDKIESVHKILTSLDLFHKGKEKIEYNESHKH